MWIHWIPAFSLSCLHLHFNCLKLETASSLNKTVNAVSPHCHITTKWHPITSRWIYNYHRFHEKIRVSHNISIPYLYGYTISMLNFPSQPSHLSPCFFLSLRWPLQLSPLNTLLQCSMGPLNCSVMLWLFTALASIKKKHHWVQQMPIILEDQNA